MDGFDVIWGYIEEGGTRVLLAMAAFYFAAQARQKDADLKAQSEDNNGRLIAIIEKYAALQESTRGTLHQVLEAVRRV